MDEEARQPLSCVDQPRPTGQTLTEELHFGRDMVTGCSELALLVEFAIVGQVALGGDPEQASGVDGNGTVQEPPSDA